MIKDGIAMNHTYTLLSKEQVFGEAPIDVIRALGTKCGVTDFGIISGADVDDEKQGKWFLSSASGYGDVCLVDSDGSHKVAYSTSRGSVRPVMKCQDISQLHCKTTKDITGFKEVQLGEYPQSAADRELARTLEQDFSEGRLRKTGKKYQAQYEEYQRDGHKYIRVACMAERILSLSNGKSCKKDDIVWIEVAPVKWLYDEEAALLVSRQILVSGVLFSSESYYDEDFEKTSIYSYLNTTLAEDLIPSILREMTPEEKAEYENEIKRAAKRRNPYNLTFGEVSEEDIIRGAIESDVAVFLHGPSSEGKSARVKQIDPTCEIIYLRNATPDSLNGRSVYNQSTGEMIDIPPTWFKKVQAKCEKEPDKLHVVFFDEINNALPSIQGMAFNIVLDREVKRHLEAPRQREDRRRGQRHTGLFGGLSAGGAVLQQICPRIYQHHHRKMVEMGPGKQHPSRYLRIHRLQEGRTAEKRIHRRKAKRRPQKMGNGFKNALRDGTSGNAARSHRRRHHR